MRVLLSPACRRHLSTYSTNAEGHWGRAAALVELVVVEDAEEDEDEEEEEEVGVVEVVVVVAVVNARVV